MVVSVCWKFQQKDIPSVFVGMFTSYYIRKPNCLLVYTCQEPNHSKSFLKINMLHTPMRLKIMRIYTITEFLIIIWILEHHYRLLASSSECRAILTIAIPAKHKLWYSRAIISIKFHEDKYIDNRQLWHVIIRRRFTFMEHPASYLVSFIKLIKH